MGDPIMEKYEKTMERLRSTHGQVLDPAAICILADEIDMYRDKIKAMERALLDYERLVRHSRELERRDEKHVKTIVKLAEKLADV